MSNNIYATPEAELTPEQTQDESNLASRWARLGAAFVDGMLAAAIVLGSAYLIFGYESIISGGSDNPAVYMVTLMAIGFFSFILLHGYTLSKYGQTLGKKMAGIKVVTLDGKQASFARLVLARYLIMQFAQAVPVIGGLVALINLLMIFGSEKRCGHDVVAGTKVVNC